MKNILIFLLSLLMVSSATAANYVQNSYDTVADATVKATIGTQIAGSNFLNAAQVGLQVAGSNYLNAAAAGTQIGGSNYLTATTGGAQIAGSNYLTAATAGTQIGGSNYLTAATAGSQIGGSNYTTRAQITSSNFLMMAPATNWFVLTNGSDANAGTASNAATAFRTIQKAVNTAAQYWYTNITPVSIQLGPGIFNENVMLLPFAGNAVISIGGEALANIAPSSGDAVTASGPIGGYVLQNMKLWATNGSCLTSSLGASVVVGASLNFATANSANYHMLANNNGSIIVSGNYTVSGGAHNHYYATRGSVINDSVSPTVTVSGTPAFTAFAACDDAGVVAMFNVTFSGSATGKRFDISLNGVMHTLSGSATYFPGNTAGTTNSGAQYQ